jgi:FkbM family methyltransferase
MGSYGCRVVGFEPNPYCAVRAQKRCAKFRSVSVISCGVGASTGIAELYFPHEYLMAPELHSGSASLLKGNSSVVEEVAIQTLVLSLEEVLSGIERVDFLKIDIEGSEFTIWPTIEKWSRKITYLAMETHENSVGKEGQEMLARARQFVTANGLEDSWRLDWP